MAAQDAPQNYTFAFQQADAAQVIDEVIGRALSLSYTVDPAVNAPITFRIEQTLTPQELFQTFESTLATYDIVVLRNGESLLITTRANARTSALRASGGQGGYATETVILANVPPSRITEALTALGAEHVVVFADTETNSLVLGGTEAEIAAVKETIAQLDRRISPENVWVELQNVSAEVVARELTDILAGLNMADIRVAPISRLRGIMIFGGTTDDLARVQEIIARLDTSSPEGDGTLWYYRPRNVGAESLSLTINEVLGNSATSGTTPSSNSNASAPTSQSGVSRPATTSAVRTGGSNEDGTRVAVDYDSNTLVISSPPDRRLELLRLLEQLDVRPRQVLIEASVLEVTLGDEFRFGVDWSVLSSNGSTLVTSTNEQTGAVAPSYPGFAITYLSTDIEAAVDALGSRTDVEVVSAPKIMVLDNRSASLQIGDQVPIVRQTAQSNITPDAPRVVNVEYRDTGVQLDVTPRVTGDDDVTLIVSQEVSSVSRTTTSGIDSPTIQQRRFDSSLLLNNGGTVALGGLIASNTSNGAAGVPLLQDIPLFGNLFKSTTRDNRRTELIVLISVQILSDPEASAIATEGLVTDMRGLEGRGLTSQ